MLRRLMMDDNFFRGELIYVFDGDAAGRAAAVKAFEGEQNLAGQSFVAVADDGMDPCDLRLKSGDGGATRSGGAAYPVVRVRHSHRARRPRPRQCRGSGVGCCGGACRWWRRIKDSMLARRVRTAVGRMGRLG